MKLTPNTLFSSRRGSRPLFLTTTALVLSLAACLQAQDTKDTEVARLAGHTGAVMRVAINTNNDHVFSAGADGTIRIWPIKDWKSDGSHTVLRHPARGKIKSVDSFDLSPDQRFIAAGGFDGIVSVWQWNQEKASLMTVLTNLSTVVAAVRFSPDSKRLAAVQRDPGRIALWDITGDKLTQSAMLETPGFNVWSLSFASDSKHFATGVIQSGAPKGGAVWLWDLTTTPPAKRVLLEGIGLPRAVTFSPDGRKLVYAEGNVIHFIDAESGSETGKLNAYAQGKVIVVLAFSPDGKRLVCGGYDNKVIFWDIPSSRELQVIEGTFGGIEDVKSAAGGQMVVAAAKDSMVHIWKLTESPKGMAKEVATPSADNTGKPSAEERLKKVKALFDQGLINKEDYDKKVKEIMESL